MFGERLRELRRSRDVTQNELAQIIGVSGSAVSAYENGKKVPGSDTLMRLAEYFDCSIDYLMGKTEGRKAGAVVIKSDDLPVILRDAGFIAALVSREALAALSEEELRGIALRALEAIEGKHKGAGQNQPR
jgi:transcriptional regulator with XRE-family HTH domain